MTRQISAILIDSNDGTRNEVGLILKGFNGKAALIATSTDLQDGMKSIQNSNPDIVILEVKEVEKGAKEIGYILSRVPQTAVFVTTADKNPDWILRLIRAGASEYLTKPIVAAELVEAIKKTARGHARRAGEAGDQGAIVSVYNPSGGMGTTMTAVNLAAALAARGEKVALVDLNMFSGDVPTFLNFTPRYTLANVTTNMERVDVNFLMSVMALHSSGMHILSGPGHLEEAAAITAEQLQAIIPVMRSVFTYTIIDTGGQLFGCNQGTFACSDHILYTTVLNLPALKTAKRYFTALDREGFGPEKVKLCVNRHIPKDSIKVADAEKLLNTKTYITVPNAYAEVKDSINRGMPLLACYPKSIVTKTMDDLACRFMQETARS